MGDTSICEKFSEVLDRIRFFIEEFQKDIDA